jgi:hypothetical protein
MTVLDKMCRKGLLARQKQGKAHVYRPAVAREAAVGAVVDQVVRTYFAGSYRELVKLASLRHESPAAAGPPPLPDAPMRAERAAEDRARPSGDIDEFLL